MKSVFILCAGNGERLKPLTDHTPKPLIPIKDKPILSYIFSSLPDQIEDIFLVIQEKHLELYEKFLKENIIDKKIKILFQEADKKGTYYALMAGADYIKNEDNFLVLNGDDIFLKEDLEELIKIKSPSYGLSYKTLNERYRTCDLDETNKTITSFRHQNIDEHNKPVLCFSGAYTLTKDFIDYEPIYVGDEAGIPHTLFASGVTVYYLILKHWFQINTMEDLKNAEIGLS